MSLCLVDFGVEDLVVVGDLVMKIVYENMNALNAQVHTLCTSYIM